MFKELVATSFLLSYLLVTAGCTNSSSLNNNNNTVRLQPQASISPEPIVASDERTKPIEENAHALCNRLDEIRKLNFTDPIYKALIEKKEGAVPCLIRMITDTRLTRDPREPPPYMNWAVGDTAVFILLDITKANDLKTKMLPPEYRKEAASRGIYSYFSYVSEPKNRSALQKWWQDWLKKNIK